MRNALLVGINQTKFLVWGTLSEAATNIFFDYGLIYGHFGMPELGFNGAAYASILAEATGLFVIYIIIHAKGMHRTFSFFEQIKWDASVFKLILVQSAPLVAQYTISIVCWEFFYILIEHQGSRALAISNTMRNIIGMFGVFAWAFGSTANTMVSNIIGQGRTEEVIALIKRISFVSLSVSALVFLLLNSFPEKFLSFYGQSDEFILEAIPVVRIVSRALLLMSFATVWLNAVTGSGNSVVNLLIELVALVVYCLYVYLVLEVYQLSISWGWGSECVYWIIMFSFSYAYILSGRWRGKKI
jgi:Na+-driven multidrug efflux pump